MPAFAEHWIEVQREEFERLGVVGDWAHPYTTMDFSAEAQIARELMKFAANGTLYRGSKPVMWSVVEKTALAEAEVEYEDYTSRYGVGEVSGRIDRYGPQASLEQATDTKWTVLPECVSRDLDDHALDDSGQSRDQLSRRNIEYGFYEVTDAPAG